jgi:hypothetical protein
MICLPHLSQECGPARTSGIGIRGRVEVIFGDDNPAGGYEVVTKPPLGKCSIKILKRAFHVFRIIPYWDQDLRASF